MELVQKKIWALLDERQGNTNQTLGVAEALGIPFEIKPIEFNHFIRIPNILINHSTVGMTAKSRALLTPPWPDIVISTARRLGIVASYIKYKNPKTFTAQIQWPGFPATHFDLIAAPKHDNTHEADNIFVTLGAPHRVTAEILQKEAEKWRTIVASLPSPRIAVLIGGNSGYREFSQDHARKFAVSASNFAQAIGGSLLLTTSRRTSLEMTDIIAESIAPPHYFYRWDDATNEVENPFYGFLGLADAVIATGDSISMCSEACATGKPLYVYISPDFASTKHQQFVNDLFAQGMAKPLQEQNNALFNPPFKLDDASAIAKEIKKRFSLYNQQGDAI